MYVRRRRKGSQDVNHLICLIRGAWASNKELCVTRLNPGKVTIRRQLYMFSCYEQGVSGQISTPSLCFVQPEDSVFNHDVLNSQEKLLNGESSNDSQPAIYTFNIVGSDNSILAHRAPHQRQLLEPNASQPRNRFRFLLIEKSFLCLE